MEKQKKLYVMISRTDTGVGEIIRNVTGFPYNHVSVTLDPTFRNWVSFARYRKNTPLYSGFVREPAERFLAKGQQVLVRIFAVDVTEERYHRLKTLFSRAGTQDPALRYNFLSLLSLIFGVEIPIPGAYTCLGFANTLLGTDFKTIDKFNEHFTPWLYYDGELAQLAPDNGCRDDLYFTSAGFFQDLAANIQALLSFFVFALTPGRTDPVTTILNEKGATP